MLIAEPRLMEDNGKTFTYDGKTHKLPDTEELIPGVYNTGMNLGLRRMGYEEYPVLGEVRIINFADRSEPFGDFNAYGVCDHYQQVLDQCPEIVTSERQFVITLAEMRKEWEDAEGGWRWHKWGAYIGTHDPQCEYLYDEPVIEAVFCFHVYEKRTNAI